MVAEVYDESAGGEGPCRTLYVILGDFIPLLNEGF
jgi:hypothetical protein